MVCVSLLRSPSWLIDIQRDPLQPKLSFSLSEIVHWRNMFSRRFTFKPARSNTHNLNEMSAEAFVISLAILAVAKCCSFAHIPFEASSIVQLKPNSRQRRWVIASPLHFGGWLHATRSLSSQYRLT
jgi:hypothetical protein